MSSFQMVPELPLHPDPKKPTDFLGHMSVMCSDILKDIHDTDEIQTMKKVQLNLALMQLRKQIKAVYAELNPPKKEEKTS